VSELEPHYRMIQRDNLPVLPRNPVHVILDNIRSAFNVGSIFRTSDAGAIAHVHLCGMTAYPPNLKLAKTALGAFDYMPWTHHEKTLEAVTHVQSDGIPVVAIEITEDAVPLYEFEWSKPVAILFGNEVRGVSPEVLDACDATVKIPMHGYKNSINVATAFGVVLYEILRGWHAL
jgi:23S rRNA (guanosine2251-2'-O)-methyltransferase